jgi:hypothetical protein
LQDKYDYAEIVAPGPARMVTTLLHSFIRLT